MANNIYMHAPANMVGQVLIFRDGSNSVIPSNMIVSIPADDIGAMLALGLSLGSMGNSGLVPENRRTVCTNNANCTLVANAFSYAKQLYIHFSGAAAITATTAPSANIIAEQGAVNFDTWKVRVINENSGNLTLAGGNGVTFIDTPVLAANSWMDFYCMALIGQSANIAIYREGSGNFP